jgi:hypothetical protein
MPPLTHRSNPQSWWKYGQALEARWLQPRASCKKRCLSCATQLTVWLILRSSKYGCELESEAAVRLQRAAVSNGILRKPLPPWRQQ